MSYFLLVLPCGCLHTALVPRAEHRALPEPTSAADVHLQAQLVPLLKALLAPRL